MDCYHVEFGQRDVGAGQRAFAHIEPLDARGDWPRVECCGEECWRGRVVFLAGNGDVRGFMRVAFGST